MASLVPGPAAGFGHEVTAGSVVDLDVTGGCCRKAWLWQVRERAIRHLAVHKTAFSCAA